MYDYPPYHYEERVYCSNYADQLVEKENVSSLLKHTAFNYMNQLDGWCSYQKAAILIDIVTLYKPETIVEIGVWGGKSLVPMACALRTNKKGKIYGIDPWNPVDSLEGVMNNDNINYWSRADYEGVLNNLVSKIEKFELTNQIQLIRTLLSAIRLLQHDQPKSHRSSRCSRLCVLSADKESHRATRRDGCGSHPCG